MFTDELLAAYPNAKVILTERDIDSWTASMENTFFRLFSWTSFYYLAPLEPVSGFLPASTHSVHYYTDVLSRKQ